MPTYDYSCETCGVFSEVRPMAEFAQPQPCPVCGDPAPRAFLSAPALGGGAKMETAPAAPMRAHPGGCACCAAPRRLTAEAV
jgi:putative FmdB family regulatory protein